MPTAAVSLRAGVLSRCHAGMSSRTDLAIIAFPKATNRQGGSARSGYYHGSAKPTLAVLGGDTSFRSKAARRSICMFGPMLDHAGLVSDDGHMHVTILAMIICCPISPPCFCNINCWPHRDPRARWARGLAAIKGRDVECRARRMQIIAAAYDQHGDRPFVRRQIVPQYAEVIGENAVGMHCWQVCSHRECLHIAYQRPITLL